MKNKTLDLIKLLCAYLVIFIHIPFPNEMGSIITSVARIAVPLFFISAGYFSYNINTEKITNRIKYLIKLFIISYIIYFLYSYFSYCISTTSNFIIFINKTFSLNNIILFLLFNNVSVSSHLWFLPALVYCYLLHYLLDKKLHLQKIYPFLCSILFITGIVLSELFSILHINLHYICIRNFLIVGLPYFLLGTLINKYKINFSNNVTFYCIFIGVILTLLSSSLLNTNLEIYTGSILGSLGLFMLSLNTNFKYNTHEQNYGKISTLIYIIHPLIIHLTDDFIQLLNIKTTIFYAYFNPILICVLSTIIAVLINSFLDKISKRL